MKLNFEVRDTMNRSIGKTTVAFDWGGKGWAVTDDKLGAWKRVATRKIGKFVYHPWGVIHMMDQARTVAIVHDSPRSAFDMNWVRGTARLFQPLDATLKDAHALWNLDMGGVSRWRVINTMKLPFDRTAYMNRISSLFPAPYDLSENSNYTFLTKGVNKDKVKTEHPGYTSCGSLPGFVAQQVALSKGHMGDAQKKWVEKYGLEGTKRVRDQGRAFNCWVEAASDKRPKPGDVYALLDYGATDKKAGGISHVGVFEKESGNQWTTLDLGQGGGFDGKRNTREYRPGPCELTGEINQGGGFRVVAGWVDLEKYFKVG